MLTRFKEHIQHKINSVKKKEKQMQIMILNTSLINLMEAKKCWYCCKLTSWFKIRERKLPTRRLKRYNIMKSTECNSLKVCRWYYVVNLWMFKLSKIRKRNGETAEQKFLTLFRHRNTGRGTHIFDLCSAGRGTRNKFFKSPGTEQRDTGTAIPPTPGSR